MVRIFHSERGNLVVGQIQVVETSYGVRIAVRGVFTSYFESIAVEHDDIPGLIEDLKKYAPKES